MRRIFIGLTKILLGLDVLYSFYLTSLAAQQTFSLKPTLGLNDVYIHHVIVTSLVLLFLVWVLFIDLKISNKKNKR